MRPVLKLYITLVCACALLQLGHDLSVLAQWPYTWSLGVTIALIVLTAIGDHLQFEMRRGWYTNASAAAHVAAAFLLPPGLAILIAAAGVAARAIRQPITPLKAAFNVANIGLAVGTAAHVAATLGGPDRVAPTGLWTDPVVGLLVSCSYCAVWRAWLRSLSSSNDACR